MSTITPVLMSRGTGSRLWPLSREAYPKQLLPLLGEASLLQQTLQRVTDSSLFGAPLVVANADQRFLIAEQVRALGSTNAQIILEPFGPTPAWPPPSPRFSPATRIPTASFC
ncbi:sugar phosphate nucleotidyltransferase [Microvirga aerilata]|uniref:sugar phosphate nucleotidyltransferase n=1 Tax=Microvirga aerilata TaxID=670292 RepID=UPI0028ADB949|nr:sugar phosphate nucleotidyltransferase [Microvirga aerilata]